ncbi:hypothetical protein [Aeromonas veronii]|uniref:hypothetical protein n=1 Tax=Aeromonas veronii TaxID=654 RepID=UPI0012F6F462|nr:hypothetical protein [Aeromonas veronii]
MKNAKVLKIKFPTININSDTWDFHITDDVLIKEFVDIVGKFLNVAIDEVNSQIFVVEL